MPIDVNSGAEVGGKEKEDEVKDVQGFIKLWMERITISKQASDDWFKKSGVERVIEEYNGKFQLFQNGLKGRIPVPPINTIWAYVQTDIASTYNRDPFIAVNPRHEGSVLGAKLWESILNYYWKKLKLKEELEPEIIDKDLCGFAWHKVGWACEWWMDIFGIADLKDRNFLQLSSGEQRLVLLARAFVKDPELLILDEPLHGLDLYNRRLVKDVIETFCRRKDKTMIMVTHYQEELPACITNFLFLKRN